MLNKKQIEFSFLSPVKSKFKNLGPIKSKNPVTYSVVTTHEHSPLSIPPASIVFYFLIAI